MEAARFVKDSGMVYALDKSARMIEHVAGEASSHGAGNVTAGVCDNTSPLPLADDSVDLCFLSTVFHIPEVSRYARDIFAEVRRVLKPAGRLAIVECRKEDMSFGPPMDMRWAPEELEALLSGTGYRKIGLTDLGYCYLLQFTVGALSRCVIWNGEGVKEFFTPHSDISCAPAVSDEGVFRCGDEIAPISVLNRSLCL